MQITVENSDYAVEYTAVNMDVAVSPQAAIDVAVGDAARIDVGEALNYIKSGQAEIEAVVQEKTAAFNLNAEQKTDAFNDNAESKTSEYNLNAADKLSAFNENATSKTGDFNTNASNKTTDFNNNAISKTTDFNDNATDKTNAFNSNASDKTTDFNDNYTAKKALIDAEVQVAKDWATKTDGTVDGVDYSSKYYAQSILPYASDITTVAGDLTNINAVAADLTNIDAASGYAAEAKQWAIGDPSEPTGNSAKYWANQAQTTFASKANVDLSNLSATGEAKFVKSVTTGSTNGTISVDGTSVAVYGLGTAAYTASTAYDVSGAASTAETNAKNYADGLASNYATAAQGALADTAVQPADLATVATTGAYSDLSGTPTIPTVNNPTITITQGGVSKGSFTLNQATDDTIALDAGGGGGSYTAGTGIDITNNVISVTSPTLVNGSSANWGLSLLNTQSNVASITIGDSAQSSSSGYSTGIGHHARATGKYSCAYGAYAYATASYAIQIGYGTNSEANSFYVSTSTSDNWKMLGSDGLIPDARISSNIARSADIPTADQTYDASSTNAQSGVAVASAIDTVLAALYPVGSLYIGTQSTCPLATLISGSTWTLVSSGKALWTGDGTNANTTIAAGLPNIDGSLNVSTVSFANGQITVGSGVFANSGSTNTSVKPVNGGSGSYYNLNFDASQSSSIYGNSNTVQPPAYVANIWRRTA